MDKVELRTSERRDGRGRDVRGEFEAFIEDFSKSSEHLLPLPTDFSRADIYTDRD
jgi:hypothetical protein